MTFKYNGFDVDAKKQTKRNWLLNLLRKTATAFNC